MACHLEAVDQRKHQIKDNDIEVRGPQLQSRATVEGESDSMILSRATFGEGVNDALPIGWPVPTARLPLL
jgi:hypothetical protein